MDYQLTEDERAQATHLILPAMLPIGRKSTWNDLTELEKTSAEQQWRAKHPRAGASGGGLTPDQLDVVGHKVYDAMCDVLPGLVADCIKALMPELVTPLINNAVAASESGVATSVEAAMVAAEAAAAAVGKAGGGTTDDGALVALRKDIDELKTTTLTSLERRASRHADHLAGLESRLKKLER